VNDGLVHLEVEGVAGTDVRCRVVVGGEIGSRKGVNLPGIDLGIAAFTDRDRRCLEFALENGVDAVSQSFVESAADVERVQAAARELGYRPFVIAKIERGRALDHVDEILAAADGLMIARGHLGVEVPIEQIAVLQKVASIAAEAIIEFGKSAVVVVPTGSGRTENSIARFRLPVWIAAVTSSERVARHLHFSYGVHPVRQSGRGRRLGHLHARARGLTWSLGDHGRAAPRPIGGSSARAPRHGTDRSRDADARRKRIAVSTSPLRHRSASPPLRWSRTGARYGSAAGW
jgi:pyruvate kinase